MTDNDDIEELLFEYRMEQDQIREQENNKLEELLTPRAIVLIPHITMRNLPDYVKGIIIHRVECLIDCSYDFPNSVNLRGHLSGFHLSVIPRII